ncbi:MAG: glycosyltransferase family 4 protein, partial [Bacteroidetes bacterium]|nr:glycosyltransferase family 4 protein [Bacteroidota bacterium]
MLADGESIHTTRWCRHFADLGHEIHLITFKDVQLENIHVHFVNSGGINVSGGNWKVIFKYKEVKHILKKIKPDVLHSLYATSYGMVGALSGFHPYIVTPLGSDILISPKDSIIYRSLLKFTFKKADLITSMAPHMTEVMMGYGVKKEKIAHIVLGINTTIFNRKNRKLSSDEFVITSTRNFEAVYNIPHFLKAIFLVKNDIPGLRVNIIGSGSLRGELESLVQELKISDVVIFLGKVPQTKVVEILNSSHVFVIVSLSDGNALSLIESMACGAYPIATNIPANREWVEDGVNGRFVNIDDVRGLAEQIKNVYSNFDKLIEVAMSESAKVI